MDISLQDMEFMPQILTGGCSLGSMGIGGSPAGQQPLVLKGEIHITNTHIFRD